MMVHGKSVTCSTIVESFMSSGERHSFDFINDDDVNHKHDPMAKITKVGEFVRVTGQPFFRSQEA
jgi:hypothetical protein